MENFVNYILTQLPLQKFVQDDFLICSPNNCTAIINNGGTQDGYYERQDFNIQFLTRNDDRYYAKKESQAIYNLIRNKFGLVLPEVTIGGDIYPEIITAKITPNQPPGAIGADDEKRFMYSFNIVITTI